MSLKTVAAAAILAAAHLVAGHGAIIDATTADGGRAMGLGVDPNTPRDGTRAQPFQVDSTRFKGPSSDTVGQTTGGGENDIESGTQAIMAMTGQPLPQIKAGGTLELTVHQVNADGGGPYTCDINEDGTATSWTEVAVPLTVPGQNSRNRDGAITDHPMRVTIPAGQACTGTVAGQQNVCLVRCMNAARAGPFGGVVPVQMMQAGATPAAARRNLGRAIAERERQFKRMMKRAVDAEAAELEEDEE
ncbi:Putative egh16-like virulence factor [Colletotrichum destructivum]|uniref:Egh16-like virulence factor n=1 Tax=Colletotrichum destructivum TaxID=34406 RepID=A0AAX4IBQ9_9PEZI|nr:Putative egh16-like virulence factor [Colletotrichum destructivum]